jgi:hypothetical protein
MEQTTNPTKPCMTHILVDYSNLLGSATYALRKDYKGFKFSCKALCENLERGGGKAAEGGGGGGGGGIGGGGAEETQSDAHTSAEDLEESPPCAAPCAAEAQAAAEGLAPSAAPGAAIGQAESLAPSAAPGGAGTAPGDKAPRKQPCMEGGGGGGGKPPLGNATKVMGSDGKGGGGGGGGGGCKGGGGKGGGGKGGGNKGGGGKGGKGGGKGGGGGGGGQPGRLPWDDFSLQQAQRVRFVCAGGDDSNPPSWVDDFRRRGYLVRLMKWVGGGGCVETGVDETIMLRGYKLLHDVSIPPPPPPFYNFPP